MALPKVGGGFVKAGRDAIAPKPNNPPKMQIDHTSISMEMGIDPPMDPANAAAELAELERGGPPDDPIWADHRRKLRKLARGL